MDLKLRIKDICLKAQTAFHCRSYLEHFLIQMCYRIAGDQVRIALTVRLPGNGGPRLSLLRETCLVGKYGAIGHIELHVGLAPAIGVGKGHEDQGLLNLPDRGLRGGPVIVVVLGVLHMLALTAEAVLAIVAHQLDSVVQVCFRHVQPISDISGAVGLWHREQGIWFW